MNGKHKILIIDDSEDVRFYLKVLFSDNYQIFLAKNGKEGIAIALKEIPELILCDVMMPEMNGLDCCQKLKSLLLTSHIPVLLFTSRVEEEDIVKGLNVGADDYLSKPFNPEILKSKIAGYIRNRILLHQTYVKQYLMQENEIAFCAEGTDAEIKFMELLVRHVDANLSDKKFCVKCLADFMKMSQATLYRKVKQITALSIIELIRNIRLKRAGILLKHQKYTIQEVSEMVGYNDIPTFRKHFTDFFGTVPSNYAR